MGIAAGGNGVGVRARPKLELAGTEMAALTRSLQDERQQWSLLRQQTEQGLQQQLEQVAVQSAELQAAQPALDAERRQWETAREEAERTAQAGREAWSGSSGAGQVDPRISGSVRRGRRSLADR